MSRWPVADLVLIVLTVLVVTYAYNPRKPRP